MQIKNWLLTAISWLREGRRVELIHYEDLSRDPIPSMEGVSRFLGLHTHTGRLHCIQVRCIYTGPVHTCPVHTGPVHTGPVHTGPVHTGPVHTGPVHTGPVHTGPVHTGPVHTGPVQTGPVHTGQMHADQGSCLVCLSRSPSPISLVCFLYLLFCLLYLQLDYFIRRFFTLSVFIYLICRLISLSAVSVLYLSLFLFTPSVVYLLYLSFVHFISCDKNADKLREIPG